MLYWIFDLDQTLYRLERNTQFRYSLLNKNTQLDTQLRILPLKKILFTNGTVVMHIRHWKK